jgi:hypothetical protein
MPRLVPIAAMQKLVEDSREPCDHCHRRGALNPHRMCDRKVRLLHDCIVLHREGDEWIRIGQGDKISGDGSDEYTETVDCARALAGRLIWFGLVESQGHRSGLFKVTERGEKFLGGTRRIPAKILCRDGDTIYVSEERVTIVDVIGIRLNKTYWDGYPESDFYLTDEDE